MNNMQLYTDMNRWNPEVEEAGSGSEGAIEFEKGEKVKNLYEGQAQWCTDIDVWEISAVAAAAFRDLKKGSPSFAGNGGMEVEVLYTADEMWNPYMNKQVDVLGGSKKECLLDGAQDSKAILRKFFADVVAAGGEVPEDFLALV